MPGTACLDSPENAGPEWRLRWSTLDLNQANGLLDKVGLTKKDGEGYRLRTDNGQRLRLEVTTVAASVMLVRQSRPSLSGSTTPGTSWMSSAATLRYWAAPLESRSSRCRK